MPSPFPGMDPYIEGQGLWDGFHAAMVTHCAELINHRMREGFVARIRTKARTITQAVSCDDPGPVVLIGCEPDAPTRSRPSSNSNDDVTTIAPVTVPPARTKVELRHRWIEILDLPDMDVITVVEILSPSNKSGTGRTEYLAKRATLLDRPVNFVEIDLLLRGRRMPMAKPLPPGDYYAVVGRTSDPMNAQVYAWPIRHVLPAIPIPLRAPTRTSRSTCVKRST